MELNYIKVGDYLLPNLTIEKQNNEKINKYGYLRLHYLKENNKPFYTTLLMKNELTNHLISVSIEVENRLNILMEQYKNSDELLSEKSKMDNQFQWVRLMNNYKIMADKRTNLCMKIGLQNKQSFKINLKNVWKQMHCYVLASTENLLPHVFYYGKFPSPLKNYLIFFNNTKAVVTELLLIAESDVSIFSFL